MIQVYFQTETAMHSELVAVFKTEEMYSSALPWLEVLAKEQRCIITESVVDPTDMSSALSDAIDELELNIDVLDGEQRALYVEQLENLGKLEKLIEELS